MCNLIKITTSISKTVYIAGRWVDNYNYPNVIVHSVGHKNSRNIIIRSLKYVYLQTFLSYKIFTLSSRVNTWILFFGGEALILPILIGKFLNKNMIILFAGSIENEGIHRDEALYNVLGIFKKITCRLSTTLIVYSKSLISFLNLEPYRHKILIAHRHFLDFTTFTVTSPYHDRPNLIGYIGRLRGEKGVQHFAEALPAILSNNQDLRVLIGGDGQLKGAIEASLQDGSIADRVDLPGWISHDELPKYLNQLRLLVLPSYTEGLPNIMLEAMACGTPVLATPVGAIPDVIRDGETGFIMEDNSPECIARNVMRALDHPDLEKIAERGRKFVEEEYTFEKVVEKWKGILKVVE